MYVHNIHHRFHRQLCGSLCMVLTAFGAGVGCINSEDGNGNTTAFSDLLDDTVPDAPTTSDNNSNEPTGGNIGNEPTGGNGDDPADANSTDDSVASNDEQAKVLELVNDRRGQGANCGSAGSFDAAGPLTANEVLAEIAQAHSVDMSQRDFFDHTNPDGEGPGERIEASTYEWSTWGENIAAGYRTPEAVVEGWMDSDGHCSNIMNPAFTEIGVGYEPDGSYWTQVFGAPR